MDKYNGVVKAWCVAWLQARRGQLEGVEDIFFKKSGKNI